MLPFTRLNSGLLPIRRAVSRALKSQFPRLNYAVWAWRNPGKTFKAYYVETVVPALEGRKRHASLGPVLKPGRNAKALRKFNQLIALGISPTDTLVDYGCGTLRVGRSFIEFLEAYRYIGMDIDNRILDAGRRSLPAELIASKRPVLEVISRESLIRVAAQRPRWIIAKGVLQHVPPGELNEFFESLAYLVHAGSEAFLFARCAKESTTLSSKTWLHTFDRLQEAAERNGMELDRPDKRRKFLKLRALGVALIIIGQISAPILPALSSCRLKGGRQFFLSQRAAPRGSSTRRPANGRAIKVPRLIDKMITCLH